MLAGRGGGGLFWQGVGGWLAGGCVLNTHIPRSRCAPQSRPLPPALCRRHVLSFPSPVVAEVRAVQRGGGRRLGDGDLLRVQARGPNGKWLHRYSWAAQPNPACQWGADPALPSPTPHMRANCALVSHFCEVWGAVCPACLRAARTTSPHLSPLPSPHRSPIVRHPQILFRSIGTGSEVSAIAMGGPVGKRDKVRVHSAHSG